MFKALALKELREAGWLALVAAGLHLAVVSNLIGLNLFTWLPMFPEKINELPFTGTSFTGPFALVGCVLAIALGFRQSAWEGMQGTYLFLLHRPVARSAIFATKIGVGMVLLLLVNCIPVLWFAAWAATPGNYPGPFEWRLTEPAWGWWCGFPLLYLGAFLSGIRPARWYGTRLYPLLASGMLLLVAEFLSPWWTICAGIALTSSVLFATCIRTTIFARDYS